VTSNTETLYISLI